MKRLKAHPIFICEVGGKLAYCRDQNGSPAYWAGGLDYQSFPSELSQALLADVADALGESEKAVATRLLNQLGSRGKRAGRK